jgi:MoaA/NifB/PqqE/SkfB family radical SAM enzyme
MSRTITNTNIKVKTISIDASSICQLKCPECSTTKGIIKNGVIGSGFLTLNNFKHLVTENPEIKNIELSNWGEIFLNPHLDSILKYSFDKNISLSAGNGVNFNNVTDNEIESLVKHRFHYLNISIDGASQDTYMKYRVKGDFDRVISNIKKLNSYKEKYNSPFPFLSWQFIIFGHNEHEILAAREISTMLQMTFIPKLNFSNFSPIINPQKVKKDSGMKAVSRDEYKELTNKDYKRPCCQLWFSPQISWDGKVLGCCVNKWKSFGNAFISELELILQSNLYAKTMNVLKGLDDVDDTIPCYYCSTFKNIHSNPITNDEIEAYSSFIHPAVRYNS